MTPSSRTAPRVLHIEDEAPIRLICRFEFELNGMEVLEAADGLTGLELARREFPDLIVLGVLMPGLDGWSVARRLLDDPATRDIPIVFLTTLPDTGTALLMGAAEFIRMPFDPAALVGVIQELLALSVDEREQRRREKLHRVWARDDV